MNAPEIARTANILARPALKGKHLSTENFFNLIALKKKLKDELTLIIEFENELAKEYKATEEERNGVATYKCDDDEFFTKLGELQKQNHEIPGLRFIPKKEFKAFVEDIDLDAAAFLAENLMSTMEG